MLSIGMSASLGELAAHAQSAGNVGAIRVEGNKRVEPETVKTYLTFQCRRSLRPGESRRIPKSLVCHRLVPGCSHQARGRYGRYRRGREPDRLQGRLRRQQRGRGRRADCRSPAQAPHRLHQRAPSATYSAFSTSTAARASTRRKSIRKSSSLRTTASTLSSKSMRARPPRFAPSISSATPPSAICSSAT